MLSKPVKVSNHQCIQSLCKLYFEMCLLDSITIYIQTLTLTVLAILSTLVVSGKAPCCVFPTCLQIFNLGTGHPGLYIAVAIAIAIAIAAAIAVAIVVAFFAISIALLSLLLLLLSPLPKSQQGISPGMAWQVTFLCVKYPPGKASGPLQYPNALRQAC